MLSLSSFFSQAYVPLCDLHSFPTRRSSDLSCCWPHPRLSPVHSARHGGLPPRPRRARPAPRRKRRTDRRLLSARRSRRSEEHTSELQSLRHLVCRLLLEKKNKNKHSNNSKR